MSVKNLKATQAELLNYAWLSGDRNPIHYNQDVAKKMKLPGVIAQGMWVHSRCWAEFEKHIALVNSKNGSKKWSFDSSQTKFQSMLKEGQEFEVVFENTILELLESSPEASSLKLKIVARSLDQAITYAVVVVDLKLS